MGDPMIGSIALFAGNFAPRGWALCEGQLLPISSNTALFSILGTIYGGDGRTTFALPDLRGRAPIGNGQGPGLANRRLGQESGAERTLLTVANMPAHSHQLTGSVKVEIADEKGDAAGANGRPLAKTAQDVTTGSTDLIEIYAKTPTFSGKALGGVTSDLAVANNGGSQNFNNMQPFLVLNYCIAIQGTFPSRN